MSNPEECRRCFKPNDVTWAAESPLWNYVMRENDIEGHPIFHDLVCISCFIELAFECGIPETSVWRLTLVPAPEQLIYETPSGRIWDAEQFLWVTP